MTIKVSILCVDGETVLESHSVTGQAAKGFLDHNNHEGSSVSIALESHDDDTVYKIVELLAKLEKKRR